MKRIGGMCLAMLVLLPAAGGAAEVLTLEQARRLARERNPSLKIARESLLQSELLIDKAWSAVKPQWTATGTYTHYNTGMYLDMPDFTSIGTSPEVCGPAWNPDIGFCFTRFEQVTIQKQDSFNFYTQVTQPIFVARTISAIRSAYKAYDLARLNERNSEEYLLYSVEVAYYGALAAQRFVDISAAAVKLRQEHLRVARAKFEVGETPKITALSAEISLTQAQQDLKSAEKSLEISKENLRLLCGVEGDFSLAEPPPPAPPGRTLEQLVAEAFDQRRDLQGARLNLELAEEGKRDAWYRFLPSLVATGNLRVADVKGFTNEYVTWQVGLALSVPLYDGGLRYAYLKEARSRIRQARYQLEQTRRNVASELRQLWLRMEVAAANLDKAHHAVELARERVDLARASFEAGASTHLEVEEANSALFISEMNEAQQQLNYNLAVLRLDKARTMYSPLAGGTAVTTSSSATPAGMAGAGNASSSAGASAPAAAGAAAGSPLP